MNSDLVRLLCALAAFAIPLGIAWLSVRWHAFHREQGDSAAADPSRAFPKA